MSGFSNKKTDDTQTLHTGISPVRSIHGGFTADTDCDEGDVHIVRT